METNNNLKRGFWVLGALLFLVGLVGWYDRLAFGHREANYNNIVTWGLWIAAYIYFIGLSAGSFLISSLVFVFGMKQYEKVGRLAVYSAVVTLLMALLSVWADLGHMERAWEVTAYPNFKSPMAWMIWLYSGYFALLLAEMWFLLRADLVAGRSQPGLRGTAYRLLSLGSTDASPESAARDHRFVRVLATIGVPLAVMFHGGVGALFGTVASRPHWHSGLFPILFLLSALVSGGALLTMMAAVFQSGLSRNRDTVLALGRLVLGLLLLDVLFQVSELLVAYRGGIPGHVEGWNLTLFGPYWYVFWIWQLGMGTLIPIALLALPTRKSPVWVAIAGLLIAAGIFGLRLNIVIPGLAMQEVHGLVEAVNSTRITTSYFPSTGEWLLTAGIVGFGLLLFGFGETLLPRDHAEV